MLIMCVFAIYKYAVRIESSNIFALIVIIIAVISCVKSYLFSVMRSEGGSIGC